MNNMYYPNTPQTGEQSWYNQPMTPMFSAFNSMNTNVYKVTSLEEAIMKSNMRPSETVYFNQSKDEFYTVRVDVNGNKTWQTFVYMLPNTTSNTQISKSDFDALVERVLALEGKNLPKKEGVDDVQSNG